MALATPTPSTARVQRGQVERILKAKVAEQACLATEVPALRAQAEGLATGDPTQRLQVEGLVAAKALALEALAAEVPALRRKVADLDFYLLVGAPPAASTGATPPSSLLSKVLVWLEEARVRNAQQIGGAPSPATAASSAAATTTTTVTAAAAPSRPAVSPATLKVQRGQLERMLRAKAGRQAALAAAPAGARDDDVTDDPVQGGQLARLAAARAAELEALGAEVPALRARVASLDYALVLGGSSQARGAAPSLLRRPVAFLQAKLTRQNLAAAGLSVFLSYGFISNINSCTMLAWCW